jgi:hypothetical protein
MGFSAFTTFEEGESRACLQAKSPASERIAKVDRLQRECLTSLRGTNQDGPSEGFADLYSLLNAKHVESLIARGYRSASLGELDIFVRPDVSQVERTLAACANSVLFGFPSEAAAASYMQSGVEWEQASTSRRASEYGGATMFYRPRRPHSQQALAEYRSAGIALRGQPPSCARPYRL